MKKFLEKVAEEIFGLKDSRHTGLAVILPNKRSEIFLKNYLKEKTTETFWLPEFYTTDEFIVQHSGLYQLDPILIYFDLYDIHKELLADKAMPVEDFLSWAPIMLSDFNDIDLYQVDAAHVFKHLTEAKAIEQWNLSGQPLTTLQKDYLTFYQSLFTYYTSLKSRLIAKKLGYKGMIYQYLVENVETLLKTSKNKAYICVGFNALSKAEKAIFGYLKDHFKTTFYWDADAYYMHPEAYGLTQMEAGRFIRELIKDWKLKDVKWIGNELIDSEKRIHVHGIAKPVGLVKYAGKQLSKWFEEDVIATDHMDTAIVISDENLLLPLLHSLPKLEKNETKIAYNITMGYPLKNSSLSRFILQWLTLIIRADELKTKKYATDTLIDLLKSAIIKKLLEYEASNKRKSLIEDLTKSNQMFLDIRDIQKIAESKKSEDLNALFTILLKDNIQADEFMQSMIELVQLLASRISEEEKKENPILGEQINVVFGIIKKVQALIRQQTTEISLKALQKILMQLFRNSEISLKGEPLKGIQIMGMLETRNLDFKNIIFLSANEGLLPKASNPDSFIPFDIRFANQLPLPKEQNDVATYHFYRLLQGASNVSILYNTDSDKLGSGEKSRFILQIENELSKINPSIRVKNHLTNVGIEKIPGTHAISISKDADILKLIADKGNSGFSASALNVYRNCSLKFYFREILKLEESSKIASEIEFNIFGNAIHDVLEDMYKQFVGKMIDPDILKQKMTQIDGLLKNAFHKNYKGGHIATGKNYLIFEVAKKYIEHFIKAETEDPSTAGREIVGLEEKIEIRYRVEDNEVALKGYLDRIEKLQDQTIRIIDYKTGRVESGDLALKEWEEIADKKKDKLFQLLFYAFLYQKKYKPAQKPELGIYSLRMRSNGLMEPKLPDDENYFEAYLTGLIREIFDPSLSFEQTSDEQICSYCDYKDICNR
ncbi:MAG: PD-(D/E)XK nuclease family protein [Bacteroidales bacterium]|nr:PD-(D/E)XK nuclease family protein [Bacteroidales bacterium]